MRRLREKGIIYFEEEVAGVGGGATPWKKIKELSRPLGLDVPYGGEVENEACKLISGDRPDRDGRRRHARRQDRTPGHQAGQHHRDGPGRREDPRFWIGEVIIGASVTTGSVPEPGTASILLIPLRSRKSRSSGCWARPLRINGMRCSTAATWHPSRKPCAKFSPGSTVTWAPWP